MSATTTLIGNLAGEVDLRFTKNGRPVASLTIAVNDRKFDKAKNEYVDGDTWFARCTIWGEQAEQAAQSLTKGTRVIASGRITERSFEDKDGNQRRSTEVTVDEIGPSLRYATAQVTRVQGGSAGKGQQPQGVAQQGWDAPQPQQQATFPATGGDVWGAPGASYSDEIPF